MTDDGKEEIFSLEEVEYMRFLNKMINPSLLMAEAWCCRDR